MSTSRTVLIIGASGGIGTALCEKLHLEGVRLILGGRSESKLKPLAEQYGACYLAGNAKDSKYLSELCELGLQRWGALNGSVNLAGSLLLKAAHSTTEEEFQETLEQNLLTAFNLVRTSVAHMKKKGGSIVLVSSVAARLGLANHEAIAAAKAGVEGLTLSAAATYASFKIRINAVAPGLVKTPLTEKLTSNEMMLKASTQMHPLNRIGDPDHIASAIAWFLNPEQSWVTGQILGVDGGLGNLRSNRA